jgi:hypothetical protein
MGLCLLFGSLIAPLAVQALTPLSQSYKADTDIPIGSIVSLVDNTTDQVEPSNNSNIGNMLGIVIGADDSLLSLSSGTNSQVQVVTTGTVPVLVSDMNGPIKQGDHITASPLAGVGVRANSNIRVVGIAQGDLKDPEPHTYTDSKGTKHTAKLGEVPVLVNVAYYFKQPDKTIIPSAIQNIANALAGKAVDTTPILISGAIFLVTIAIVVSITYSMIRSSIISVGRNPLSQSAIYRNLLQLSSLAVLILGLGFGSIYLILTRL